MCSQPTEQPSFSLHFLWTILLRNPVSVYYSREALKEIHKDIVQFATAEQLTAHANSIAVRFEKEDEGDSL